MTDTTIETPRRPFAVRDAIPLVLGLGLFATGALLFVLDIGGHIGFVFALVGFAFYMLFIHRENRRKGLPNGGAGYYTSRHHPPDWATNPANPNWATNPANPASWNWYGRR
ncbi:MAG: hypothetical protein K0U79_10170 [Gammaproteobacteria bacterium]|nr:hypothetical protein [Gammaproteobacteria bacterium]